MRTGVRREPADAEEDVKILVELGMDDLEMALRFVVPREAMQLRLESLGLRTVCLRAA